MDVFSCCSPDRMVLDSLDFFLKSSILERSDPAEDWPLEFDIFVSGSNLEAVGLLDGVVRRQERS